MFCCDLSKVNFIVNFFESVDCITNFIVKIFYFHLTRKNLGISSLLAALKISEKYCHLGKIIRELNIEAYTLAHLYLKYVALMLAAEISNWFYHCVRACMHGIVAHIIHIPACRYVSPSVILLFGCVFQFSPCCWTVACLICSFRRSSLIYKTSWWLL